MIMFIHLVGIILLFSSSFVFSATVNGRITIVQNNNDKLIVLVQINTETGTDDLGGTTIVFEYDTTSLAFPNNPVSIVDYTFHNFSGGNYSPATITRPIPNQIWVNIDLPFVNSNNGTTVAANPSWSDVVTIKFDVINPNGIASLNWLTTSPFWGIYDADNSTLWKTGEFKDFPTSIEEGQQELPTSFELSQNYPNPFNSSTRIKYSIPTGLNNNTVPVRLKVYDILGNEVITLVDEQKEPGVYEVEMNSGNREIASGIYIFRIVAGNFVSSKKMILLK